MSMNEYGLFEQRSGLGKRGSFTAQGQRITTRQPQLRSQRQGQPDNDKDEIYEDAYPPRLPTSSRRYTAGLAVPYEEDYQQVTRRVHVGHAQGPQARQPHRPPAAP